MNRAYIGKLMELAEKDINVIHLLADSGTGYDEIFRTKFPRQMFNFGITEENMVAAASGMAMTGKIPFVFTAGAFLAYRSMEFIRDDVCFQNLNVKIIGMGSGLSWSSLGPTHHTTEDISVLRAIPNLMIFSAATPIQVRECIQEAYEHIGPVYLKIEMNNEQEFFEENYRLSKSGMDFMKSGSDVTIFTTGSILSNVMEASRMLEKYGITSKVVNVAKLKPFAVEEAFAFVRDSKLVVSVEEHNIYGGLGSILAETMAYYGDFHMLLPIGLEDRFAEGYGTHAMVQKINNLDAESICMRIRNKLS